jgi:hypothetical protein
MVNYECWKRILFLDAEQNGMGDVPQRLGENVLWWFWEDGLSPSVIALLGEIGAELKGPMIAPRFEPSEVVKPVSFDKGKASLEIA